MPDLSIIGAGAVGLALADALSRHGVNVEVVVRQQRQRDLAQRGLWAKRLGTSVVPIRASVVDTPSTNTLLMTPKSYALPAALEQFCRGRGAETTVVLFQNGISADATAKKHAPQVELWGGIVTFTSTSLKAGEVELLATDADKPSIGLGCDDAERNAAVRTTPLFELLSRGLDVRPVAALDGARWCKLIINLNNALFAATGWPARRVYAHPYGPWLAVMAMREGLAVAKASGVKLAKIPWASPMLIKTMAALPDGPAVALFKRQAEKVLNDEMDTLGSTLQSLKRGEPTEIEDLNGTIVRLAAPLGVAVPLNAALTRAVVEQSQGGRPVSIEALCEAAMGKAAAA